MYKDGTIQAVGKFHKVSVYNLTTKNHDLWRENHQSSDARKWKDQYPECIYEAWGR